MLVPEGLIEFVPEVSALISELNELLAGVTDVEIGKSEHAHAPSYTRLITSFICLFFC